MEEVAQDLPRIEARRIALIFSGPLQPRHLLELEHEIEAALIEATTGTAESYEGEIAGYRRTLISVIRILCLAQTTGTTFDGDGLIALIRQRLGEPRPGEAEPLRLDP